MSHQHQYATYGLPRYVLTFLHHMESHKDCLKWNIVEGSHKLTLTLTWNFRKNKTKETLWEKLQRTMKLGRASGGDGRGGSDLGSSAIPRSVSRFIKRSAQELHEVRPYKTTANDDHAGDSWGSRGMAKDKQSHHHHHHHWSKLSSQSLPGKLASSGAGGQAVVRNNTASRRNFISSYSSYHNLPSRVSRLPGETSPFHGSWPGVSFDASSEAVEHSTPTVTTPDMTSRSMQPSPSSSTNRQSSSGCYRDNSATCSKTGDDDDYLADDLTEKSSDGAAAAAAGVVLAAAGPDGKPVTHHPAGAGVGLAGTRKHSGVAVGDGWSRSTEADFWPRLRLELLDETLVASGYGTDDFVEMGMGIDGGGGGGGGVGRGRDLAGGGLGGGGGVRGGGGNGVGGGGGGGNGGGDGRIVNETVLKCLDSCDKILFRHSTTIT